MGASDVVVPLEPGPPDLQEALRYLGHGGQELPPALGSRLEELAERCRELARPRACLRSFEVSGSALTPDGVPVMRLDSCALELVGHDIARHLAGAQAAGLMAVTLGTPLEQELRRLSLTDPTGEILLDAVATALVEQAADQAEGLLAEEATRRGLHATWRYSPGYGDFPLKTQRPLLAALDAQRRLGLSLTDSLLMIPTKSVTAVVGMLERPPSGGPPGCAACALFDRCSVRAKGSTCHD